MDEQEVLFTHVQSGNVPDRCAKGLEKVMNCRLQAKRDGYSFIWIDTCCIDQRSSAELSEAINSMFAIYARAHVCYAYLADVDGPAAFSTSRWFKRGWTLQELIAPRSLEFFASDWSHIGDKETTKNIIHAVTGIDSAVLIHEKRVSTFSHATIMSYAAGRETTRPEDRAYSLMGLFGVHMPVIYGEGGKNAFLRLQYEILSRSPTHSLLVWRSNERFEDEDPSLCDIFGDSPDLFAGRKSTTVNIPLLAFTQAWNLDDIDMMGIQKVSRGIRAKLPVFDLTTTSKVHAKVHGRRECIDAVMVIACKIFDPTLHAQYTLGIPLQLVDKDSYARLEDHPFVNVHSLLESPFPWQNRLITIVNAPDTHLGGLIRSPRPPSQRFSRLNIIVKYNPRLTPFKEVGYIPKGLPRWSKACRFLNNEVSSKSDLFDSLES